MERRIPRDLVNADLAVRRYADLGERWLDGMWQADPLADAVVNDDFGPNSATDAVRVALADGVDAVPGAPDSLRDLFAFLDDEPAWVDHDRIDNAADALVRHTPILGMVLGAASLLRGAGNFIAGKPLALTGRYVSRPAVRSVEVGEWLRHVLTRGGMRRDGGGFAFTVRVRLIHAHVRKGILASGVWDEDAWGVPIPQSYMALTMAEFGHIAVEAMQILGVRFTDRELDDIYHLWRYVGHVIGMGEELGLRTERDHIAVEDLYRLTSPGPSDEDREFVTALTEQYLVPELANLLPGTAPIRTAVARTVMHSLQRVFIGDADADALHIPDSPLKHLLGRVGPLLALVTRVQELRYPDLERTTQRAYKVRDVAMDRMRVDYRVEHDLVDAARS
ncbi:oxygenase MpaB family protein [Rhodococcus sp. BUPNP1]|uniref:oxygenase MpaB family protein n=1 Tax=Rhodococcus sp. BUPNP1 TaxID=1432786 RepID=UPI000B5A245D|nr:oxygenase MpaB family protein [Rhodococcus sp. BUPNP1]OWY83160.1 TetR family transcriptional regulator [Rhodococcus sp. BUPNP1]